MSLNLVSSPIKTVAGVLSNVNASITQEPFTFLRADFTYTNITDAGVPTPPNNVININFPAPTASDFTVGDVVAFITSADQENIGNVQNVFGSSITVDILFSALVGGGAGTINNLTTRPDYAAHIELRDTSSVVFPEFPSAFIYKPSQVGNLFIDVGPIIVTLMEQREITNIRWKLFYKEVFTGSTDTLTDAGTQFALLGERSIGQIGGSNLAQKLLLKTSYLMSVFGNSPPFYRFIVDISHGDVTGVLTKDALIKFDQGLANTDGSIASKDTVYRIVSQNFSTNSFFVIDKLFALGSPAITTGELQQGQLLTRFKEGKLWRGFTGTRAFLIADDNFVTRTGFAGAQWRLSSVDINKLNGDDFTFDAILFPGLDSTQLLIFEGADRVFTRVQVFEGTGTTTPLTSPLIFYYRYMDLCPNPVMVEWVNSLGASEYFVFEISQRAAHDADAGLVFETPFDTDVSNITMPKRRLSSDETLVLTCTADKLTNNDLRALAEIKTSEKVEVWLDTDGSEKIGVTIVQTFTTSYDTGDKNGSFSVSLEFPGDYDFFNLKRY